jgi:cytoskeletal protein CcmA (bactofilin family)
MQTLRGNREGPLTIETDTVLRGNVSGDVIVRSGCQLELRGNLMGDIILEGNAQADVRGNLMGNVRQLR